MERLRVDNISKTFIISKRQQKALELPSREKTAINDISFHIQSGEVFGLLGPNGAGKTTTMRIIASLIKPDSGNVYLNDIDVVSNPGLIRSKLAFLTTDLKLDLKSDANSLYDFFLIYIIYQVNRVEEKKKNFLEYLELISLQIQK